MTHATFRAGTVSGAPKIRAMQILSALSRHYDVSRRTIIRDLRELVERRQLPPEAFPEWEPEAAEE